MAPKRKKTIPLKQLDIVMTDPRQTVEERAKYLLEYTWPVEKEVLPKKSKISADAKQVYKNVYFEDVIMCREDLDLIADVEELKDFVYKAAVRIVYPGREKEELLRVTFEPWKVPQ